MKKIQRIVWIGMLLFFSSPVFAAAVPERTGIVTDPIGLFTPGDTEQMKYGLQNRTYELLVLTAQGLDESQMEQLANDAYYSWSLGPKQLLLILSVEPDDAHLVFDNEELAGAISRSPAGNAESVVTLQYAPLAGQGKVKEGVIAISDYINALQVTTPSKPQGQGAPPVEKGSTMEDGYVSPFIVIGTIVIIAAMALFLLRRAFR